MSRWRSLHCHHKLQLLQRGLGYNWILSNNHYINTIDSIWVLTIVRVFQSSRLSNDTLFVMFWIFFLYSSTYTNNEHNLRWSLSLGFQYLGFFVSNIGHWLYDRYLLFLLLMPFSVTRCLIRLLTAWHWSIHYTSAKDSNFLHEQLLLFVESFCILLIWLPQWSSVTLLLCFSLIESIMMIFRWEQ